MTAKDMEIQRLRGENEMLREQLQIVVESMKICRYCRYLDADCSPSSPQCRPEWKGNK